MHEGVHRDVGVQLAVLEHLQRLVFRRGELYHFGREPVAPRPVVIEIGLHAVPVYADALSVERGRV